MLALIEKKRPVKAKWDRCNGCQLCQLICSFVHEKVFNPTKAAIRIERLGGKTEFGITFTPECDHCGTCADYCFYGALTHALKDSPDHHPNHTGAR